MTCNKVGGNINVLTRFYNSDTVSDKVSPTFGRANANFSVVIEHIRRQFLKK